MFIYSDEADLFIYLTFSYHTQQFFQLYDGVQFFIGGRENPATLYNVYGKRPPTFCK
jgi:hypothetical protein